MFKYKGLKDENLALNHMANVAILAHQLDDSLVSLVTGSPPLWVRNQSLFLNFWYMSHIQIWQLFYN